MVRHFIKPGITGLAQVSGYRGEVEDDNHIINRVKYDIFYLENWSLLMDIKIVFQTVYNALRGEEKSLLKNHGKSFLVSIITPFTMLPFIAACIESVQNKAILTGNRLLWTMHLR